VPTELETEKLCVLHFLLSIEHTCARLRRETVIGGSRAVRRSEIAAHVKGTAARRNLSSAFAPPFSETPNYPIKKPMMEADR
jgi:hypothetical protein